MANVKFQNSLNRVPQNVPPIWFMRQAGRYHQHYQKLRAQHSFMELCKNPDLAAEVALGPIRDFDFDVSILFSDLLFPLEALGMGLTYDPAPELGWHLTNETMKNLRPVKEALKDLEFQKAAMQKTRKLLSENKSLIGFIGGPWTLFTYAVESSHKGSLEQSKKNLRLFAPFCDVLIPLLISNIQLQLEGGAEVVMLFDTSAGELSPQLYKTEVVPQIARLVREFPKKLGYYAKGVQAPHLQHELFADKSQLVGLGFDHRWDLRQALATHKLGFVQGNFDQSLLFMEPSEFEKWAGRYLSELRELNLADRVGWVAGLGHGVLPGTPEANVRRYVQLVREIIA